MSDLSAGPAWTEVERLAALRSYGILDTPPERAFDDIVSLTGQLLDAPIVAVNLIDAHRQWFKSEIGLGVREMPLDNSICKFALLEADRMVVTDTRADSRFSCNPLVTGGPRLRFYAGELLKSADGLPLGTLCVLDVVPRPQGLTALQAQSLKTLAQQVVTQLELRKIVAEQNYLLLERKATNSALQRAQERSVLATEAADLGVWSWNPVDDAVVWENTRPYDILGLPHDAPAVNAARFLRDFVHPDDAAAFTSSLGATLATGIPFQFEGRMRRTDGQIRWVSFIGKSQQSTAGMPPMLLGVVSDVTARKVAEAELIASRERFENIVSQAATGVVQADSEGRIIVANERFCAMLGYERTQLLGMNVAALTAPESLDATRQAMHDLLEGATGRVIQKQYRRQDGSLLWASSSVSAVRSGSGQFQGFVAIVVDISQERLVEEGLRKIAEDLAAADQRKSEFLATLAHELRNPLAPISSGLTVLKLGGDNAAAVGKIRAMMERQVAQMVRLIDDLLDVARISGGKIELQRSPVDVRTLLAAAVETSMPFIERGGHQLAIDQPADALLLDADPARIAQVLSNLLNNAAKYTPLGGRIAVTVAREDDAVCITVADNGIGIAADCLSTIFLMFKQVDDNMHRAQGGLGVGLSLVKRLVEMHGGTVSAASQGSGKGSEFTVRLPLAAAA